MRQSFVWNGKDWVDAAQYHRSKPAPHGKFPTIITDMKEYRSIYNDQWITSRSQHREHLKANNLEEIGDEKPGWMKERERMRADGLSQDQIETEEQRSREQQPDTGITFQWEDIDE